MRWQDLCCTKFAHQKQLTWAKKVYWMNPFNATAFGFTFKGNRKGTSKGDVFPVKASFIERRKPLFWISTLLTVILEASRSNKTGWMTIYKGPGFKARNVRNSTSSCKNMNGCMMDKYCQHRLCQFHHEIIKPDCDVAVEMLFVFTANSTHDLLEREKIGQLLFRAIIWSESYIRHRVQKNAIYFVALENSEDTGKYSKGRSDDLNF